MQRLAQRLAERKIQLELSSQASDWLATAGYDPVYGARPLKRAIQRELETPIAKAILAGRYSEGSTAAVDVDGERLSFCLLYTSPSPRDKRQSRMPSSA